MDVRARRVPLVRTGSPHGQLGTLDDSAQYLSELYWVCLCSAKLPKEFLLLSWERELVRGQGRFDKTQLLREVTLRVNNMYRDDHEDFLKCFWMVFRHLVNAICWHFQVDESHVQHCVNILDPGIVGRFVKIFGMDVAPLLTQIAGFGDEGVVRARFQLRCVANLLQAPRPDAAGRLSSFREIAVAVCRHVRSAHTLYLTAVAVRVVTRFVKFGQLGLIIGLLAHMIWNFDAIDRWQC